MTGQYYQPPPPQPYGAPPSEADSIKSMLNIAGILALIFGILFILGALYYIYAWVVWESVTSAYDPWGYTSAATSYLRTYLLVWFIVLLVFAIMDFMIFFQTKSISDMVNRGQYVQAKSKTLVWTIIGFIFGGLLPGILMLIAYLKFDPVINSTRAHAYGPVPPPQYGAPPPQYGAPPPQHGYGQAPPPKTCMGCGRQIPPNHHSCPNCGRPA